MEIFKGIRRCRINPLSLPEEIQRKIYNGNDNYEYVYVELADDIDNCRLVLSHTQDYIQSDTTVVYPSQEVLVGILADII